MMENVVLTLATVAYTCSVIAYFKRELKDINNIEKTLPSKPQKLKNIEKPCYECL